MFVGGLLGFITLPLLALAPISRNLIQDIKANKLNGGLSYTEALLYYLLLSLFSGGIIAVIVLLVSGSLISPFFTLYLLAINPPFFINAWWWVVCTLSIILSIVLTWYLINQAGQIIRPPAPDPDHPQAAVEDKQMHNACLK
jgi:hypothetical protein